MVAFSSSFYRIKGVFKDAQETMNTLNIRPYSVEEVLAYLHYLKSQNALPQGLTKCITYLASKGTEVNQNLANTAHLITRGVARDLSLLCKIWRERGGVKLQREIVEGYMLESSIRHQKRLLKLFDPFEQNPQELPSNIDPKVASFAALLLARRFVRYDEIPQIWLNSGMLLFNLDESAFELVNPSALEAISKTFRSSKGLLWSAIVTSLF